MSKKAMIQVKMKADIQDKMIMTKWPHLVTSKFKLIVNRVTMAIVKVRKKSKRSP